MAFGKSNSRADDFYKKIVDRLNELTRRVRDVESNRKTVENKVSSLEDRIVKKQKKRRQEIDQIKDQMEEINTKLMKFDNEINKLKRLLEDTAQESELEEIKSYIDLLSPMKSKFVTESEVKRLIKKEINNTSD